MPLNFVHFSTNLLCLWRLKCCGFDCTKWLLGQPLRILCKTVFDIERENSAEVFEEVRDHSPLAKKIDDAFQKALREIGGTMAKFEGTFVNQRNRVLGIEA